ncbi:ArsR/SmtB family transcription factor [Aeromonas simiae]|uniref:Winged helix-turn-helix transcriptional regulator n=1 Tax=Aeromonas simiae TaxID=218936 RepID=A0A5J6WXV2_9GAMM|nr:metalloregulator ArsR/SmtB family transcription factor [Aeromonas simiae]MDO2948571.1 metalloregulator ArsR/SmtB family transcription factor [Aeromonas simiae]MDO2952109.1 metalloregulator ArsR/SmtB family transcription factor [Aeromonas simiae]MDO2955954.1 metalloregulator ArsR/SmtB family transcription factor [Aeromonas simiae]QFI56039.1 winged helix-turn-helix transcriptional regulator [Aeromonas simiae]
MELAQMEANASRAVALLKALANERRLFILCHLLDKELSVSELNGMLGLSQSALSQHLAVLRRDGLVATRKEAQTVYYSLNSHEVREVISLLHSLYCQPKK